MALLIHNNCEPLANAKFLNSTMFKLYRAIAPPCWAVFSSISYAGFDLTYFIDSCASRNLKAALEPLLYSSSRIHFLPLSILSPSLRREVRVPESYIYRYVLRPPSLSPYSSLFCRIPSFTPCLYRAFHTRNPRKRPYHRYHDIRRRLWDVKRQHRYRRSASSRKIHNNIKAE